MSQTETLLLVVLGFALATLIGLFAGRLLWFTALRLGARRMQKQVPSTLADLQTERDRLRAEYAMLSQRLGARLETARLRMAEQMAEVSRHRNRIETLEGELAARTDEAAGLSLRLAELEKDTGAAADRHARLEDLLAQRTAERDEARDRLRRLEEAEMADHSAPPAAPDGTPPAGLADRIAWLNGMARKVADERQQDEAAAPAPLPASPLPAEALGQAARETADIQQELERLDAEWTKRLDEMPKTGDTAVESPKRAVANVISLANRIRALQRDLTSK